MSTSQLPARRTRMFARVLGPFLAVGATTTLARPDMRTLLSNFEASTAWPWVTGSFMLLAALVIVALHQYWHGAAAITVSALGCLFALRAVFLMTFPHTFMAAANAAIELSALWVSVDIFVGFVGLYLILVGWGPALTLAVAEPITSSPRSARAA